ncbi:hypothetical protein EDB92DRAFT_1950555 [Lactarius akahatsu]|uniref:Uncharacterized protein n=1 Tax=Lactarius akahatsu TaxID=416441 RepID=A0AAD4LF19_9AGAM|nr:hypothetical protein EDB92DRAFT_1950555 [Lactarius akahatsu]
MPGFPSARTFNTSATNRQSLAFDTSSSFLSPDTANTVGNPSDAAATLAQQRAKLKAAGNAAHHSAPVLALAESVIPSAEYRLFWSLRWLCLPLPDGGGLDRLSPVVGDGWANMKMSSNNNGQIVDLAAAKLNDLYGSSNVPRLDGPDKFRRPSKGHIGDSSNGSNNGVTDSSVYGDGNDCDFIRGHHAPGVGRVQSDSSRDLRNGGGGTWYGSQSPALSNTSGHFGGSDDGSNAMAAPHRQAGRDRNGLNLAQLAQQNGMNPFNMNMNMLNLAAMGVTSEGRLLAAQIAAAGGGIRLTWARRRCRLDTFSGLQGGIEAAGTGGAKKDEEDFEPAVLNDEMVVMDEQALEAQGVAALGARRKMLKTFEVVRKKMGIDDPAAPPPPPSSGGSAPGASGPLGGSACSGGGLSA